MKDVSETPPSVQCTFCNMEDPRVPNIAYHRAKVALSIIEEIVAKYMLLLYCILVLRLKFDVKLYQAVQK